MRFKNLFTVLYLLLSITASFAFGPKDGDTLHSTATKFDKVYQKTNLGYANGEKPSVLIDNKSHLFSGMLASDDPDLKDINERI